MLPCLSALPLRPSLSWVLRHGWHDSSQRNRRRGAGRARDLSHLNRSSRARLPGRGQATASGLHVCLHFRHPRGVSDWALFDCGHGSQRSRRRFLVGGCSGIHVVVRPPARGVVAHRLHSLLVSSHMRQELALSIGAASCCCCAQTPTYRKSVIVGICCRRSRARGSARHAGRERARQLCCLLVAAVLAEALETSVQGSSPPDDGGAMSDPLCIAVQPSPCYPPYVLERLHFLNCEQN